MSTESDYIRVVIVKGENGVEKTMKFPMNLDLYRPKRPRTTFTEPQLQELEDAFRTTGYLNGQSRAALADKLGLSDTQVKVWFQNRRTKDKKKPTEGASKTQSPPVPDRSHVSLNPATPVSLPTTQTMVYPFFNPSPMILPTPYFQAFSHFNYPV